ncbi:MAG: winged helix-turn-helix domain-containing protein, partial [Blastocatellia bacterium]
IPKSQPKFGQTEIKGLMGKQDSRVYEFADFRLETAERILSCDGKVVPLRPKLFELLVFLIERRGEILEKTKSIP